LQDAALEKGQGIEAPGLVDRVRGAVLWRSGSQILAQLVNWSATFLVIRLLSPSDYGLFAMTQAILVFLTLMSGWGFANALVRRESITTNEIRQVFGMLLLLNAGLAAAQIALAPLAAAYFRQPMVATLLSVQALIYLANPFIALPQALLARRMNFKGMAQVYLTASLLSACTALACAAAGLGVWTLVAAPMALFWTQAVGLTWRARSLVWPSFRFAGAGHLFRYGSAMVAVQFCWFVQIQSDVFVAGRMVAPHMLGIYTTALFLTQIFTGKFVPPLNDVAFAAYSHIRGEGEAVAAAFLKGVRLVMLIALPFYFGLAATAEPLVLTALGPKWVQTIPLVRILAWAMAWMSLQLLFQPATNALGRARITLTVAAAGAAIMPACFLIGIQFGIIGLARAWLIGLPLFTAATMAISLPVIGATPAGLAKAVAPGLLAASAMAASVALLDSLLPAMAPQPRLLILVLFGASAYCGLLFAFARPLVEEVLALALRRPRPAVTA
jgi:O-antigen/teichoic acid export membrane protein